MYQFIPLWAFLSSYNPSWSCFWLNILNIKHTSRSCYCKIATDSDEPMIPWIVCWYKETFNSNLGITWKIMIPNTGLVCDGSCYMCGFWFDFFFPFYTISRLYCKVFIHCSTKLLTYLQGCQKLTSNVDLHHAYEKYETSKLATWKKIRFTSFQQVQKENHSVNEQMHIHCLPGGQHNSLTPLLGEADSPERTTAFQSVQDNIFLNKCISIYFFKSVLTIS